MIRFTSEDTSLSLFFAMLPSDFKSAMSYVLCSVGVRVCVSTARGGRTRQDAPGDVQSGGQNTVYRNYWLAARVGVFALVRPGHACAMGPSGIQLSFIRRLNPLFGF